MFVCQLMMNNFLIRKLTEFSKRNNLCQSRNYLVKFAYKYCMCKDLNFFFY